MEFQNLDAAGTLEVQEVTVEEEDMAMQTLVKAMEIIGGLRQLVVPLGGKGDYARTSPSKSTKGF